MVGTSSSQLGPFLQTYVGENISGHCVVTTKHDMRVRVCRRFNNAQCRGIRVTQWLQESLSRQTESNTYKTTTKKRLYCFHTYHMIGDKLIALNLSFYIDDEMSSDTLS